MPNSVDNTPPPGSLGEEESDVIELTEEVTPNADLPNGTDDSLESLGLEMPEFKVPDAAEEAPDEQVAEPQADTDKSPPIEATTQRLSAEALHQSRLDDSIRLERGADDEPSEGDEGQDTEAADELEASQEKVEQEAEQYDRQAMVKTIQMDAFDREALEELVQSRGQESVALLEDARFSPEIITTPPPVLVKKWREGLLGSVVAIIGEQPPREPEVDEESAEALPSLPGESEDNSPSDPAPPEVKSPDESSEAIELDPDSLELESDAVEEVTGGVDASDEAIELDESVIELGDEIDEIGEKSQPPAEPVEAREPPPEKVAEPRREPAAPPSTPAAPAIEEKAAPPAEEGDSEMSGLVKELLDEKKAEAEAKAKRVRPRDIWFQEVFTEEFLRTVPDNIDELTLLESDFIEKSMKLKKKSRILDLACGFGRHSIELTERGYEVVGLDLSMPLLQRALSKAQKRSLSVKFIHGDMRELSFSGIFDGCFLWDTSLGYFDDRTNLRVLQGVQRAMKVGGRLLIDVVNRDYVVRQTPTRLWWEGKGCIFLEESEFDYQTSTLHSKRSFIYEDGTPPLEQNSYVRLYNVHELRQMLHVAGFKVLEVSGERHHKGYFLGAASRRVIVLAEKRAPKKTAK